MKGTFNIQHLDVDGKVIQEWEGEHEIVDNGVNRTMTIIFPEVIVVRGDESVAMQHTYTLGETDEDN